MKLASLIMIIIGLFFYATNAQDIIEIMVKGISDSKKDGAQQDRLEAIMDAKKQACEKAGVQLESKVVVENFQMVFDYIETQAKAVLLPGFQLEDIGYVQDGTYQVVISGKIKKQGNKTITKELRYAQTLNEQGKWNQCRNILKKYMNDKEENTAEDLKERAHYFFIKWGYAHRNLMDEYERFAAFYPNSKYLDELKTFAEFASKPLVNYKKVVTLKKSQWEKATFIFKDHTFNQKIMVTNDTLTFKSMEGNESSVVVEFTYFNNTKRKVENPWAYHFKISYYNNNLKNRKNNQDKLEPTKIIDDRTKVFRRKNKPIFTTMTSGNVFDNFGMSGSKLVGKFPVESGDFEQKIEFSLKQRSF